MTTLHVTNGDSVAGTLQKIVPADEAVLPWRDVLHDGPVPGGIDADALRQTRAKFLAEQGAGTYELILADMTGRDAQLAASGAGDHVVLWFEPDLYDQLQLLQILARLYLRPLGARPSISIVASDELLGLLSEAQLTKYLQQQRVVREVDLELAAKGWEAFTASDDTLLKSFAETENALFNANSYGQDSSVVLPHVHPALRRLQEEYPSSETGLSRTEQQTVEALLSGEKTLASLYQAAHAPNETLVWLGDSSFAWYVDRLMTGHYPLIQFVEPAAGSTESPAQAGFSVQALNGASDIWKRSVSLTDAGRLVAERKANAIGLDGIDRWIGGVHLQ